MSVIENETVLQFSLADYPRAENGSAAVITVTRTGPSKGTNTAMFSTGDGTALASQDYRGTNGVLTFLPGVAFRSFTVPIINDTLVETNEVLLLQLFNPTGGAVLGTRSTATITIRSDDRQSVCRLNWRGIGEQRLRSRCFGGVSFHHDARNSVPVVVASAKAEAMSGQRQIENLALIGFMGTGKTSVGRLAAAQLRFRFVDTDELIERLAGKSITRMFAEDGEPAFRALEARVVEDLAASKRCVISTGGGLGANPTHLASLKRHALTVCLWAQSDSIWRRVRHASHRPLLQGPDAEANVQRLLAERSPAYRQADVLINTELRSLRDVTRQVLHQFRAACPVQRKQ